MRPACATRSCVRVTRSCVCACVRLCVMHARHECDAGVTCSGFATHANSPNKSRQHVVGVNEHAVWDCRTNTENASSSRFLLALLLRLHSRHLMIMHLGGTVGQQNRRCAGVVTSWCCCSKTMLCHHLLVHRCFVFSFSLLPHFLVADQSLHKSRYISVSKTATLIALHRACITRMCTSLCTPCHTVC